MWTNRSAFIPAFQETAYRSGVAKYLDILNDTKHIIGFSVMLLLCRYLLMHVKFKLDSHHPLNSERKGLRPPAIPHFIPLLGHLPIGLFMSPLRFVLSRKSIFGHSHPVKLRMLGANIYIVQGAESIQTLFRNSKLSNSLIERAYINRYGFGMHAQANQRYLLDKSGHLPKPVPDSQTESHNRIDYMTWKAFSYILSGPGYVTFWSSFEDNLTTSLNELDVGHEWKSHPDFLQVFQDNNTRCAIEAMCGKYLLQKNPTFLKDFWEWDTGFGHMMKLVPSWIIPKVYQARERNKAAIRNWHSHAERNFQSSSVQPDGMDPYWGASYFREKRPGLSKMDGWDADSLALDDLAFIWGANSNAVTAAFWMTLEIFKRPCLVEEIRKELHECIEPSTADRIRFSRDRLLRQPILQSVFAESLRFRTHVWLMRISERSDFQLEPWSIPQGKVILTNSTIAHMDPSVWSSGRNKRFPVEEFHHERFLKVMEGTSGPEQYEFTDMSSSGSWIPFGGGPRICAGRHFAKHQMFLTAALMIHLYDCEVFADEKCLEPSMTKYGYGVPSPTGKVPVNLRRRKMA